MSKRTLYLSMITVAMVLISCDKDDDPDEIVFGAPTISITGPSGSGTSSEAVVGTAVTFEVNVTAEAGLSRVSLNEDVIKSYDGTSTSDTFDHEFTVPDQDELITLSFSVVDTEGEEVTSGSFTVTPIPAGFAILDLEGSSVGSFEYKRYQSWDSRIIQAFGVDTEVTSEATVEVVNQQGTLEYAAAAPGGFTALKLTKSPPDSMSSWGGWTHLVFNLKNTLPEEEVSALPLFGTDSVEISAGTKVLTLDVYFDTTKDTVGWEYFTSLDPLYGSEPSQGYNFNLALATYAEGSIGFDGDGYYMAYQKYLSEPNKWVTLTFDMPDMARLGNLDDVSAGSIDCVIIRPGPGYGDTTNPIYIRNLKIVDKD